MYSTCIFCHARLGTNEAVEQFPVGRRLAFDAAKGRLWAVCRACGRWNLSPLETRWEAVEACERSFRDTRVRVSTENIGLARLAEGTELVRIGAPLRPEFAAWRYGDQFGKRRRRRLIFTLAMGGFGAVAAGAMAGAVGLVGPAALLALPALGAASAALTERGPSRARFARGPAAHALLDNRGEPVLRPGEVIAGTRIRAEPRDGAPWWLEVRTARWDRDEGVTQKRTLALVGSPAVRTTSLALAAANARGGSQREVQAAVSRLERAGGPERYFAAAEAEARGVGGCDQELWVMPREIRLALEMAAHEDAERRALEGELAELERQWRAAEEIAAIADRLALPPEVERSLRRLRSDQG